MWDFSPLFWDFSPLLWDFSPTLRYEVALTRSTDSHFQTPSFIHPTFHHFKMPKTLPLRYRTVIQQIRDECRNRARVRLGLNPLPLKETRAERAKRLHEERLDARFEQRRAAVLGDRSVPLHVNGDVVDESDVDLYPATFTHGARPKRQRRSTAKWAALLAAEEANVEEEAAEKTDYDDDDDDDDEYYADQAKEDARDAKDADYECANDDLDADRNACAQYGLKVPTPEQLRPKRLRGADTTAVNERAELYRLKRQAAAQRVEEARLALLARRNGNVIDSQLDAKSKVVIRVTRNPKRDGKLVTVVCLDLTNAPRDKDDAPVVCVDLTGSDAAGAEINVSV
jgi:hypothetical protein